MKYKDPINGNQYEFKLINVADLRPGRYQRDISSGLVSKLWLSVAKGFVCPIIVNKDYEILDGQHRLEALIKVVGEEAKVPCIVVTGDWDLLPLTFNIEKSDNIKDKCVKLHRLYLDLVDNEPHTNENDINRSCGNQPYLWTLAFAYVEEGLESPSLVENAVKKFDGRVDLDLINAVGERRRRAHKVKELSDLVNEIASEYGFRDFNLKRAVLSKSTMALWGRSRTLDVDFDEAIEQLIEQIELSDWSGYGD